VHSWNILSYYLHYDFFPTYLDPKDHIQGDRLSMSKLEKQNVLQYIFTELIFFYIPHNLKYSHFNIFYILLSPYVIRKNINSIVFML